MATGGRQESLSWRVEFYRDARGRCPVAEWIDGLHDPKGTIRARIDATLIRLRESGGRLPQPYCKHLRGKLWELRWHIGSEYLRMIFCCVPDRIVLLVSGFTKTTEKTPPGELDLADRRLKDWSERNATKKRTT